MTCKRLYVLRHGDAGDKQAWAGPDDARPLSEAGITRTRCELEYLAGIGVRATRVISSPLVRAVQTAELAVGALVAEPTVVTDARLGHGFDVADLSEILREHSDAESLLIVGHEPSLSTVVESVMGGGSVVLKKGALVRLDLESAHPPRGELVWLVTPAVVGC